VENRFRAVFEGNPDPEEILPPDLQALRRWRPLLCLNLHGGTRSAWLTALSGAQLRAGFAHYRHQPVYNVRIPRAQEILGVDRTVHTAEHLASAMFYLGIPGVEIPRAQLASPEHAGGAVALAVVHPFAATPEKTWRPDGFLAVARYLQASGLDPVFIGGAGDDFSPFRAFRTIRGAPLAEIKELIARASLFVGNDSGPAHIAAAFGVPVVVIFLASDPAIWGPWRTASEVVISPVEIDPVLSAVSRLRVHA
jgi:ADP-heptose:LPS heptosyltransferase